MEGESYITLDTGKAPGMSLHVEHSGSCIQTPKGEADSFYFTLYNRSGENETIESELDCIVVDTAKERKETKRPLFIPMNFHSKDI